MPRRTPLPALVAGLGAGILAIVPALPASAATVNPSAFAETVTVDAVTAHLQELQDIAAANGGNRAVGTPGYEAGAAYVESVLREAGYTPERQYFTVTTQDIESNSLSVEGVVDTEAEPLEYTPSTDPTTGATAQLVAPVAPLGCDAAAWNGVDATGKVALVSRGTCSFAEKNLAASAAGAAGILIYNNEDGTLNGTLGVPDEDFIPGFGITKAQGEAILAQLTQDPTLEATLAIDQTTLEDVPTFNIIAETATGTDENVVMLGAHLDSVKDGPGINDNGSGSAAILETAVQLAQAGDLNNKVRFAWWGAEEIGLLGSAYYVDELVANDPETLDNIATYLNFDMVGSPNYVISVYDADQSTFPAPVDVPEGSVQTEDVFTNYFDSIGQPYVDTEFDGRSDYEAFILNGVPASGLFTGADGEKTAGEVALFGGEEGEQYDPNYHTPDDVLENVNEEGLGIMLKAIAFATASLANDTSTINGYGAVAPTAPGTTPAGQLAATGANAAPFLAGAGVLLIAGAATVVLARRRTAAED